MLKLINENAIIKELLNVGFSPAESRTFCALACGARATDIALQERRSIKTISTRRSRIFEKFKVLMGLSEFTPYSNTMLTAFAVRKGWIKSTTDLLPSPEVRKQEAVKRFRALPSLPEDLVTS